jgi:hypothetical protein
MATTLPLAKCLARLTRPKVPAPIILTQAKSALQGACCAGVAGCRVALEAVEQVLSRRCGVGARVRARARVRAGHCHRSGGGLKGPK